MNDGQTELFQVGEDGAMYRQLGLFDVPVFPDVPDLPGRTSGPHMLEGVITDGYGLRITKEKHTRKAGVGEIPPDDTLRIMCETVRMAPVMRAVVTVYCLDDGGFEIVALGRPDRG